MHDDRGTAAADVVFELFLLAFVPHLAVVVEEDAVVLREVRRPALPVFLCRTALGRVFDRRFDVRLRVEELFQVGIGQLPVVIVMSADVVPTKVEICAPLRTDGGQSIFVVDCGGE